MFGFGKGYGEGYGKGKHHRKRFRRRGEISLIDAIEKERYIVVANLNKKTLEMGIYPGIVLEVVKKGDEDTNMIIKINDSQIIVPPNVAKQIFVK